MKLDDFAAANKLELRVGRRPDNVPDELRYYASFDGAEVRTGRCGLLGVTGYGGKPAAAVADYARFISGRTLVVDAFKDTQRELDVPQLET